MGSPFTTLASPTILNPVVILVLCLAAGVATVLMLPGRREAPWAKIGAVVALAVGLILAALLVRYVSALNNGGMGAYFWVFSGIAVVGALRVVTHPRPVYSALYFVVTVMASAGLFVLMWAEFMAAALVVIYAGAILVTYVFVIMLAQQATSEARPVAGLADYDAVSREPIAAAAIGFALMGVLMFVIFDKADNIAKPPTMARADATPASQTAAGTRLEDPEEANSTRQLGEYLLHDQLVNLELAGLILTISMVGAIVIARRRIVTTETGAEFAETAEPEVLTGPATPLSDNPHSIPVYGTDNPRAKAYPEA
jgi:NADH-quinone oxidoreductase subunit J